jgi:hypothetical protein
MISRLGQAMPRFLAGVNVAGEGMRERLRTATFALFGLVTAVGLVLVGIAYNQGWPDFTGSPIPGIPTERVEGATIAADAVHGKAHSGNGPASPGSAQAGTTDLVHGRSPGHHFSSQQQLPVTVPDDQVPVPPSSGPGGADAPGSPAPASAPQAAEQPASADLQPDKGVAPVATSPPASQTADVVFVPGKGKGHEKTDKPHGKPAPVTPVVPMPPSMPAPGPASPDPPAADGPGNGHGKGNANGHDK